MENKIKTVDELIALISSSKSEFTEKNEGKKTKYCINICGGTGCISAKSKELYANATKIIEEESLGDLVSVNFVGCFGFCIKGPFIRVLPDDVLYKSVSPDDMRKIIDSHIKNQVIVEELLFEENGEKIKSDKNLNYYKKQTKIAMYGTSIINPLLIKESLGYNGFEGLIRALSMTPRQVIDEVITSGLRGRAGGGFPTGKKWEIAYNRESDQKYILCNGDEGNPGAFMNQAIMEGNPFLVIEGMLIAAYAIGASIGFLYTRAEYRVVVERMKNAIKQCYELGLLGSNILGTDFSFDLSIRLGPGVFVCGEETAMINVIEGKRGMPKPRPPYPSKVGLWDKPTVNNNVETYACVPYILRSGAKEFNKYGTELSKGTKIFSLSGKVKNSGLIEVPLGTTLREIIYDIGGGIPNGKKFKAVQTGGPSGGCLVESELDTPIDYENIYAKGSMMGSGGIVVMDEDNCMVDVSKFYMEFLVDESCGKCSPCRIGTKRLLEILTRIVEGKGELEDLDKLDNLAKTLKTSSLCGLGQTAANPILSTMAKFRHEYIDHIASKNCEAAVCKDLLYYSVNSEKCKKCGLCAKNCPVKAISGEVGKVVFEINSAVCVKCGLCFSKCPFKAIIKK